MLEYELEPTFDNIYKTIVNDPIKRNEFLFTFYDLLNSISSATTISLDGPWGSGKTFFIKQTELLLKSELPEIEEIKNDKSRNVEYQTFELINEKIKEHKLNRDMKTIPQLPIYYDAWKNDNATDPILSLIYEIVKAFHNMYKFKGKPEVLNALKEIAKSIVSSIDLNINLTKKTITPEINLPITENTNDTQQPGVNINVSGEKLSTIFDNFDKFKSPDLLEDFKKEDNLHELINQFFDKLSLDNKTRLVIFIDELDRCKPTYAIQFLERIKHYFDRQNITFVFSSNIKELINTVQNYYGNNFNGSRYLDKFFDLRLQLPKIELFYYLKLLNVEERYGFKIDFLKQVFDYFNLEMREITRFLKIFELSTNNMFGNVFTGEYEEHAMQMCKEYILPFLIGVYITNLKLFDDIINGKAEKEFVDFYTSNPNSLFFRAYEFGNQKVMCQEIYHQLFNNKSYISPENIQISESLAQHQLNITTEHKKQLLAALSLLSIFTDYRN